MDDKSRVNQSSVATYSYTLRPLRCGSNDDFKTKLIVPINLRYKGMKREILISLKTDRYELALEREAQIRACFKNQLANAIECFDNIDVKAIHLGMLMEISKLTRAFSNDRDQPQADEYDCDIYEDLCELECDETGEIRSLLSEPLYRVIVHYPASCSIPSTLVKRCVLEMIELAVKQRSYDIDYRLVLQYLKLIKSKQPAELLTRFNLLKFYFRYLCNLNIAHTNPLVKVKFHEIQRDLV